MEKHRPTDEELNRVAAEVCGWVPIPEEEDGWTNGTQKRWPRPPDYTTDRNALPELLGKVRLYDPDDFGYELQHQIWPEIEEFGEFDGDELISVLVAPCRLVVIAALKALNAWKEEWTEEA